ncbi:16S rRNA m(7)G-527 methyltransferase [Malonomonas rubra DSM 5091]|uniref:Ribosomal RNA small subunit methyltransferase G n=1 Tax=Malonomonas rubra DSM 5091 TaxID=1122189 RepID=A0A1M6JUW0_MALRU|nr:16S rRNA (guanine(527)-N(7))-methyltransferase RsmG [Malonomonas rubra]SHJ50478.1 16S rRNA m(7)G-527 methyltransferase [Malonomonas rubra DSM 5091]
MLKILQDNLRDNGIDLSIGILEKQVCFLQEMLRWNKRINLTAITDPAEALEKHLIDSLLLLKFIEKKGRMLDMGSGGGLPGIPLAIALAEMEVVSVDSVGKKINFQKHVRRILELENLLPVCSRLEKINAAADFDFVIARALSNFSDLLRWAKPVLRNNGLLYIMKGPEGPSELDAFLGKESAEGFAFKQQHNYFLPQSKAERQLYVLQKSC